MKKILLAIAALAMSFGVANAGDHKANIIVALGGDGLMLQTLHDNINRDLPIYGMNRGSIGFLMNKYNEKNLKEN